MKYRHREYTVPAVPAPAPTEIARVEAILYRLFPNGLKNRPSRARLDMRVKVQAAAREIVSGAYLAPEPKVHVLDAVRMETVDHQPFYSVAPMTLETHYDPDTYGDDGEGGISGDGLGDIGT